MTAEKMKDVFSRLARLTQATQTRHGDGESWECTLPDGSTQQYSIHGIRSFNEVTDAMVVLLTFTWSAKDWLKARAKSLGRKTQFIEDFITSNPNLLICADLANGIKHSGHENRSGLSPLLGELKCTIPQCALRSLTVGAVIADIDLNQDRIDQIEFEFPILNPAGEVIGEAFNLAKEALTALEHLHTQIELTSQQERA